MTPYCTTELTIRFDFTFPISIVLATRVLLDGGIFSLLHDVERVFLLESTTCRTWSLFLPESEPLVSTDCCAPSSTCLRRLGRSLFPRSRGPLRTILPAIRFVPRSETSGRTIPMFGSSPKQDCPMKPFWFENYSRGQFDICCRWMKWRAIYTY